MDKHAASSLTGVVCILDELVTDKQVTIQTIDTNGVQHTTLFIDAEILKFRIWKDTCRCLIGEVVEM